MMGAILIPRLEGGDMKSETRILVAASLGEERNLRTLILSDKKI